MRLRGFAIPLCLSLAVTRSIAAPECAPLHLSLDDRDSILSENGVITGPLDFAGTYRTDSLSRTDFTHIVVAWEKRGNTYASKLFINGEWQELGGSDTVAEPVSLQQSLDLGMGGSDPWYGNSTGIIDELRFFDWMLSDAEIYAEYVYSSRKFLRAPSPKPPSNGKVRIEGDWLMVDGKPFRIRGVGYQPVPIGETPSTRIYRDAAILARDLPLLRAMNVNTVRLWMQLEEQDAALLDELQADEDNPIYAIMAFEVPSSKDFPGIDYSHPATVEALENGIRDFVGTFKDHPAVLGWAIGNENNLHYDGDIEDWSTLANRLAAAAYEEETSLTCPPDPSESPGSANYHPTIVVNGYSLYLGDSDYESDDEAMECVDIWGQNIYVGYDYHCYFDYYHSISTKPIIVTEYGVDAYDNGSEDIYEDVQAEWNVHQ